MSGAHAARPGRRLIAALATACMLTAPTIAAQTASASAPVSVQATQELVVLATAHTAYGAPSLGAPRQATVGAHRPITGEQTTLPVISRTIGADGTMWLDVMLPGRPNSSSGWIEQAGTRPLVTPFRIVVDLAARRVTAYREGHVARRMRAVVGKTSTPTPTGRFFVEETLRMPAGEPGGPFALALSARSNIFQEFEGGPGQIAIHCLESLGGTPGAAASHGCMRLATPDIDWLAERIGPGTPVTIERG
jgi:lipoprotein-anchoring transpeptidase ErfK/SrfK